MQIVTPKQMAKIENYSEKLGVSKKQLMLNAGKALAKLIEECSARENSKEQPHIVFLAGSGNNGGDCFVAAELLVYRGFRVTVINLIKAPSAEPAKEMFDKLPSRVNVITGYKSANEAAAAEAAELDFMTLQDKDLTDISKKKERSPIENILLNEKKRLSDIRHAVIDADILVDGVFGTGFHGKLDKDIMSLFNIGTGAYKIAVDIPSGGNSNSGTVAKGVFKADETITFGYIKTGMSQFPLKKYCGKITVADIGIPRMAIDCIEGERTYYRIERKHLAGFPPKRERDAHKGTFGSVLVIAGSSSMRGAAAFAALGALRGGAGMVRVASVEKCIDTVSVLAPEATYITLDEDDYGFMLFDSSKDALLDAMEKSDTIVIGCGMGVTNDTAEIVRFVLANAKVPVIVDADGINCIARDINILLNRKSEVIITPHPGEMARLLNCDAAAINDNRIMTAEKYAEKFGITVVLKGAGTLVADSHKTAANHTGNAGMSRGGSGDILAGIIGATAAQKYAPFDACCAGVYIHGLAGDAAADKYGQEAMLPRDIISCLPDAYRILKEKQLGNI
ncbi:MAG TPA: NAD(P)H-hydrate dehydratase [Ruminococcus sp.]|nr:NAD(P)H-hydrate dehydratase [Ruminococcus sp.]